jgi:hypothetical protein
MAHADRERPLVDDEEQLFAPLGCEELGVAHPADAMLGRHDDRRRDHGTRERSAARFIDAGDARETDRHACPSYRYGADAGIPAIIAMRSRTRVKRGGRRRRGAWG